MALPIYIDGKFYAGKLNGVHRVSDHLVREIDHQIGTGFLPGPVRLLIPTQRAFSPSVSHMEVIECAGAHSQRWEQGTLPGLARDGILFCPANLAPLRHRRKITLIHDAQVFLASSSYRFYFAAGYKALLPLVARTSLKVLTVSEYSREMLEAFGVAPRSKSAVLYNGADHILAVQPDSSIVSRLDLQPGRYAIVFGSTQAYKNVSVVFDAFAHMADVTLVVIGPGEAALREAGLTPPPGAVFAGAIADPALRGLLEQALCLLFPSRTEGFGLPPVEAMNCGCPVVAAPAGAIPEICADTVLYANVGTPEEWVTAVRRLSSDTALRRQKAQDGKQRAAQFTWRATGSVLAATLARYAEYGTNTLQKATLTG